ncbi:sensor histidine kinase [Novosphingobium sp. AP12]|uniref:sensor histidine kinase n=1 Tax=Novosphingobium sp. AP12 TaxID=1144305 RepID=UPI000271FAA9|nr:sensor histidine kinase [Novosphingobium sp. AP12]EJL35191.1 signal transduction histidine kinase [Novosphingobium sp. AP12]
MNSLRSRLTAAVMVPLLALAVTFGGITCWMIHRSSVLTSDRILVGSVRVLSRAIDADGAVRDELLPLAVHLLQRRSAPVTHYSIWAGTRLLAGERGLVAPPQYDARSGALRRRVPAASFPRTYRNTPLVAGYVDARDADGVIQPAYLRDGWLKGKPVRVATEIRTLHRGGAPVVIQVADYMDDRAAYQQAYFLRVAGAAVLIAMTAVLLFYWAITWGLRPFASLTGQIENAQREPPPHFRLALEDRAPREALLLAGSFNGLMARTERALDTLRQFTANASHQMRTPLAIVRVHLDVLERYGAQSPRGAAALDDIANAVTSLERLLLQLIALARTEEQGIGADETFDLADVAAELVAGRVVGLGAMDIGFEHEGGPVHARGHAVLAAEMIGNLFDNAVRYNRPEGMVTVRVLRREGVSRIEVEDDGPGIAPEDRERVFERFYRGRGESGPPGSGLGLSIVRALAERMGARVKLAEGRDGRGVLASIDFMPTDFGPADAQVEDLPVMTAC